MFGLFKSKNSVTKNPTIKEDAVAYVDGAGKTFDETYNDYVTSVEALDAIVRTVSNIASMAKIEVVKEDTKGNRKPLKIKNVDLKYDINETDSQSDFIRKVFASIFTQGAAVIIAEKGPSGFINFYPYNPAKFAIDASEKAVIDLFTYTSESGSELEFKAKDVIYVNNTIDLTNLVYPISRLLPLNDMLLLQAGIMNNQKEFYESGSKDSVIISPKEPIGEDAMRQVQAAFTSFVTNNRTQALFMNTDIDVKSVSNAQSPMEIMNALQKINSQVLKSFGMPEYLLGDYQGYVSDAAVVKASQLFFQIQIRPIFDSFAHQMTKYFRNTLKLKDAIVDFNFDDIDILHDSLETKMLITEKAYKLGILSLNEARVNLELDPLDTEEANLHWLPAFLVSSSPVAIENYAEVKDSLFAMATEDGGEAPTDEGEGTSDNGATGGEDNDTLDNGQV